MSQKIKFEETSFLILVKDQEIFSKKLINYINKQNIDGEFISKKEALEDEEWGGEIWEQDKSFD